MYALNNVTTEDEYSDNNTLECAGSIELDVTVANNAAFLQYALREAGYTGDAVNWSAEIFLVPGFHVRGRHADKVRVRSAVAGKPAQVTIEAVS